MYLKDSRSVQGRFAFPLLLASFVSLSCGVFTAPGAPGDGHWDRQFAMPGSSTRNIALRVNGNKIYTAGYSLDSGQVGSNTVVSVYDGTNWSTIEGISGPASTTVIYDFGFLGSDLYVGGIFNRAGGNTAGGLAKWNGSSWSDVGGFNGFVVSIVSDGTNLYVGGSFTNCGGVFATNVAKWNGTNWSALGSGLGFYENPFSQVANILVWRNGQLYAGGAFTNAGSVAATNIAVWNGSTWSPLGGGVAGVGSAFTGSPVAGMQFIGSDLFVCGNFTTVGGNVAALNVARWNGSWSALGTGLKAAPNNGPVAALAAFGPDLYAIGSFTNAGGVSASGIARWNGSTWFPNGALNGGKNRAVSNAASLYISGDFNISNFDTPTNVIGNRIIRWNGTNWFGLYGRTNQGTHTFVQSLALGSDGVYMGGLFNAVNTNITRRIARWDGTRWYPLGSGVDGLYAGNSLAVRAIAIRNNEVFVGGGFVNAGGITANNVALWDGANWSALGYGVDNTVGALATDSSDVYVGGSFTNAYNSQFSGFVVNRIARWNSDAGWQPLGLGVGGTVNVIKQSGGLIYVGGSFTTAGGATANRIAVWDGFNWSTLGTGLGGTVNAILVDGSDVYVGGSFTTAGGNTARAIAKWDGGAWSPLGQGMFHTSTATISALAKIGGYLYACGTFTNAGGSVVTRNIARWDGTKWENLGSGVGNESSAGASRVTAAVAWGNDLYVAGIFETAGVADSAYIARWNDQLDFTPRSILRLSNPQMLAGSAFKFRASATEKAAYVVEYSADFHNWTAFSTNGVSPLDVTNNVSGVNSRFYRLRQIP
jgi:Rax2 C-terminal beta propeller domain